MDEQSIRPVAGGYQVVYLSKSGEKVSKVFKVSDYNGDVGKTYHAAVSLQIRVGDKRIVKTTLKTSEPTVPAMPMPPELEVLSAPPPKQKQVRAEILIKEEVVGDVIFRILRNNWTFRLTSQRKGNKTITNTRHSFKRKGMTSENTSPEQRLASALCKEARRETEKDLRLVITHLSPLIKSRGKKTASEEATLPFGEKRVCDICGRESAEKTPPPPPADEPLKEVSAPVDDGANYFREQVGATYAEFLVTETAQSLIAKCKRDVKEAEELLEQVVSGFKGNMKSAFTLFLEQE